MSSARHHRLITHILWVWLLVVQMATGATTPLVGQSSDMGDYCTMATPGAVASVDGGLAPADDRLVICLDCSTCPSCSIGHLASGLPSTGVAWQPAAGRHARAPVQSRPPGFLAHDAAPDPARGPPQAASRA